MDDLLGRESRKNRLSQTETSEMTRPLEIAKGEHCLLLFNYNWIPGVIIDVWQKKFVEVMFVFKSENFAQKLPWGSAMKKLRPIPRIMHGTATLTEKELVSRINSFFQQNLVCADCTGRSELAELVHGILICSLCGDVHRSLGEEVSKVRSFTDDIWTEKMYRSLIGNDVINAQLEHHVPESIRKPHYGSEISVRKAYIRAKYKWRQFERRSKCHSSPPRYDSPKISGALLESVTVEHKEWAIKTSVKKAGKRKQLPEPVLEIELEDSQMDTEVSELQFVDEKCNETIRSQEEETPLKMVKGEYCQIFFSAKWIPGVIIDASADKLAEVSFVFNNENFTKKLPWKIALDKLRPVPKVVHGNVSENKEDVMSLVEEFKQQNLVCADCTGLSMWGELVHGVLICSKCSGIHRKLGVHICKVRSLALDKWTWEMYRSLRGNVAVNNELEYHVPDVLKKPHWDSERNVREAYIRAKYERKLFIKKPNKEPLPPRYHAPQVKQRASSITASEVNKKPAASELALKAQVQYDGFLTINCFEARDLPGNSMAKIRNKGNPFCVFMNGRYQKARTRVCENTKYPKWNSLLHLNVQELEPVRIMVFDSNRITKDELLCEGMFNLSQLVPDKEKSFELPLKLTDRFKAKYKKKRKKKEPIIYFRVTYSCLTS